MVIVAVVTTISILTNKIGGNSDTEENVDENLDETLESNSLVSTTLTTLTTAASTGNWKYQILKLKVSNYSYFQAFQVKIQYFQSRVVLSSGGDSDGYRNQMADTDPVAVVQS